MTPDAVCLPGFYKWVWFINVPATDLEPAYRWEVGESVLFDSRADALEAAEAHLRSLQ